MKNKIRIVYQDEHYTLGEEEGIPYLIADGKTYKLSCQTGLLVRQKSRTQRRARVTCRHKKSDGRDAASSMVFNRLKIIVKYLIIRIIPPPHANNKTAVGQPLLAAITLFVIFRKRSIIIIFFTLYLRGAKIQKLQMHYSF